MSMAHDEEIDPYMMSEDEEKLLSDGENVRRVDNYVSTTRKEISISYYYSKEKHRKGPEDCILETFKIPAKLGLLRTKHIVTQNIVFMEQEGYKAKYEVRIFNKELTSSRKIIKDFKPVSTTLVEIKKKASFDVVIWELMKDTLKKEMMETIKKLASQIYNIIDEGVEIIYLTSKIASLLEKPNDYLPTITKLQCTFADRSDKLVYYHEFMY